MLFYCVASLWQPLSLLKQLSPSLHKGQVELREREGLSQGHTAKEEETSFHSTEVGATSPLPSCGPCQASGPPGHHTCGLRPCELLQDPSLLIAWCQQPSWHPGGGRGRGSPCRWSLAATPVQLQNRIAPLLLKHLPWLPSTRV